MPTPLTDADKVLRNDTGIDIATNIASIASALTPSNITDLGDVNLTNPITDGQVIKYDTATQKWVNGLGNITMECTQTQYDAWKQSGQLKINTLYVITDAPNLNATAQDISYDGGADTVHDVIDRVLHPVKIWSGSKYTLNDYVDIPDFDKNTAYMFEFMAFSGTYHTCFVSPVGDGYLQFVIWGDSTQHCRYRVQINTNSGRLTIVDVLNGGANQALVAIYAII